MRIFSLSVGALLLAGCTTASSTFTGDASEVGNERHIVQYYLPETVLDVSLGGTDTTVVPDAKKGVKLPYTISIQQIADRSFPIHFDVRRNYFSTTKFTLEVSADGLLKEAKASSQGALSSALSKLGSSAAKTSEIRTAENQTDVDKRLAAIQELAGASSSSTAAADTGGTLDTSNTDKNGEIVFGVADFHQDLVASDINSNMRCTFSQIAEGKCAVSYFAPIASTQVAAPLMKAPAAKATPEEKCPEQFYHPLKMKKGKPLPSCLARIGLRISLSEYTDVREFEKLFSQPELPTGSNHNCLLGNHASACRGYVFHRRYKPVELKIERCVLPVKNDLDTCRWKETGTIEAQFAVRSQTYAVQYRSAAIGSNAFIVKANDGRLQIVNTHEINAASEIVAAPFVIVNSILAVPRAILKNESTLTAGAAAAAD